MNCELTKVDETQLDNDDLMDFELQFPIDESVTSDEPDTSAIRVGIQLEIINLLIDYLTIKEEGTVVYL